MTQRLGQAWWHMQVSSWQHSTRDCMLSHLSRHAQYCACRQHVDEASAADDCLPPLQGCLPRCSGWMQPASPGWQPLALLSAHSPGYAADKQSRAPQKDSVLDSEALAVQAAPASTSPPTTQAQQGPRATQVRDHPPCVCSCLSRQSPVLQHH